MSRLDLGTLALLGGARAPTPTRAVSVGQDLPWWDEPLLQFVGPDTAKQRVTEVDGLFAVFDLDVTSNPSSSPRFRELWAKHYQTWKDFKKSVDEMSYAALLFQALSVNERAGHFARGLKDWREAYQREGGKPVAAGPREERPTAPPNAGWSTFAIILAAAAGVAAIGYAVRGVYRPSASLPSESDPEPQEETPPWQS